MVRRGDDQFSREFANACINCFEIVNRRCFLGDLDVQPISFTHRRSGNSLGHFKQADIGKVDRVIYEINVNPDTFQLSLDEWVAWFSHQMTHYFLHIQWVKSLSDGIEKEQPNHRYHNKEFQLKMTSFGVLPVIENRSNVTVTKHIIGDGGFKEMMKMYKDDDMIMKPYRMLKSQDEIIQKRDYSKEEVSYRCRCGDYRLKGKPGLDSRFKCDNCLDYLMPSSRRK